MSLSLVLRLVAALVAVAGVGGWLATGAYPGWTQTRVQVMKVDPITEIEYPEWEDRVRLGVDVLAVALAAGVGLFGTSFLFRRRAKSASPAEEKTA